MQCYSDHLQGYLFMLPVWSEHSGSITYEYVTVNIHAIEHSTSLLIIYALTVVNQSKIFRWAVSFLDHWEPRGYSMVLIVDCFALKLLLNC